MSCPAMDCPAVSCPIVLCPAMVCNALLCPGGTNQNVEYYLYTITIHGTFPSFLKMEKNADLFTPGLRLFKSNTARDEGISAASQTH